MGKFLKQSPNVDWGAGPRAPNSGIDIHKVEDGIQIGGWYDSMVGIENIFISWDELQSWIPRRYRSMRVTRVHSK